MIFSQQVVKSTEEKFNALLAKAGTVKQQEILARFAEAEKTLDEDVIFAAKWIYAHSPMSDIANYDFELFKNTAQHGVFLRRESPFAKDIPEDIFLNYVLHIRCNEEDLCDCRKLFYDILKDRVNHLSMHDAIIETNYWNAENVMYQLTDSRTISALGAYYSAYGRCGEESNFGVNVYRAIGIPCRQIYTPRWAHCDDKRFTATANGTSWAHVSRKRCLTKAGLPTHPAAQCLSTAAVSAISPAKRLSARWGRQHSSTT